MRSAPAPHHWTDSLQDLRWLSIEMRIFDKGKPAPRRWANKQLQRVYRRLERCGRKPSSNLEQQLLQDRLFEIIEAD